MHEDDLATYDERLAYQVLSYRRVQTTAIHAWLRDAVDEILYHDECQGRIGGHNAWVSATALTKMVRQLVNEAAARGTDVTALMKNNTPLEFGTLALQDERLVDHLREASDAYVENEAASRGYLERPWAS